MSSIDQQFVEFIVKSLVSKPDAVQIERRIDEKGVLLELTVDPEDLGRVIGKRGATAQSLRTLLRALGTKNDARYNLKIVDNGEPHERRPRDDYGQEGQQHQPAHDNHSEPADDQRQPPIVQDDANAEKLKQAAEEIESTEPETEATDAREDHDSIINKTRAELKEFDDLDV